MGDFIKIKGVQDELEVHENKIVITPKGLLGFLNKGIKGSKDIPFSSITSIQLKKATLMLNGYIQFSILGGSESKRGIFGAVSDENTFVFNYKANEEIEKVKQFLEPRIGFAAKQTKTVSIADEIRKLHSLLEDGAISREEFEAMKAKIIGKAV